MKSFASTITVESTNPEWAGVTFTVRRLTEGLRIRLRSELASALESIRETVAEAEPLEGKEDPASLSKIRTLGDRIERLQANSIDRAHVLAGLVKISGLQIDGESATPLSLIESGPVELYLEARDIVRREGGLSEKERKNSESPITSGAAADGRASDITADTASAMDSMQIEIAQSTSLGT